MANGAAVANSGANANDGLQQAAGNNGTDIGAFNGQIEPGSSNSIPGSQSVAVHCEHGEENEGNNGNAAVQESAHNQQEHYYDNASIVATAGKESNGEDQ